MSMRHARWLIVIIGILLPYAARLPFGVSWLAQYAHAGIAGHLLIGWCNAIAWGSLLILSFKFQKPVSLLLPALLGFGFLAWAHASLDLTADAQSSVAILFIPIYAMVPIGIGGLIGLVIDKNLFKK